MNKRINIKFCLSLIILLILLLSVSSCFLFLEQLVKTTNRSTIIRVKLTLADPIVLIRNQPGLMIKNAVNGEAIKLPWYTWTLSFSMENQQFMLNNHLLTEPVFISPKTNRRLLINGKSYFGSLKIIPDNKGLQVINYLPLDTYLISVLPSELPISFHPEAIKAQTIVARTYAYLFIKKNQTRKNKTEFDVDDTTRYQLFKSFDLGLELFYLKKIKQAIIETKGIIIVYEDEPIIAYFHANSGGWLVSGKDYFGRFSDFPYLVGKEDPYSLNFPSSQWQFTLPVNRFNQYFDVTTDLTSDYFITNTNGLLDKIVINERVFTSRDIRKTVGYSLIKSDKFKITLSPDHETVYFNGFGYGHGVGLSQWGAEGMAEQGYHYQDIIAFYYPETKLRYISYED